MAARTKFMRQRHFTLDEQVYRMRIAWPSFDVRRRHRQMEVLWVGTLKPAPASDTYTVAVLLRRGWCPETRVLRPGLKVRDGSDRLPHTFADGSLCLHVDGEWSPWMFVADTTIPWASAWLYFYEVWHATNLWLGGGTHPERKEHRSE
jgi:hypothetical protein